MQKKLTQFQIEGFYHDAFLREQVTFFKKFLHEICPEIEGVVLDIGGGVGFFAREVSMITNKKVRVYDTDDVSVASCNYKLVEAYKEDAINPKVMGDESVICFNMVLHHLVGDSMSNTDAIQLKALQCWQNQFIFINEYCYDGFLNDEPGRLIYLISRSNILSFFAKIIGLFFSSLRSNTLFCGVRFRSRDSWINFFYDNRFSLVAEYEIEEEKVSFLRRLLLIRKISRRIFIIKKIKNI